MASRYSNAGDMRTQLFSGTSRDTTPSRTSSPYDKPAGASAKHNESFLSSLEAQNNDDMDSMGERIAMIKNLSVRMGSEINKSIKLNDNIQDNMERGKITLKNTYNRMVVMSEKAGISCKVWFVVFGVVFLFFFYVWIT